LFTSIAREGIALIEQGRVQSGIGILQRALEINADSPAVLHHLSNAMLSIGCADHAIDAAYRAHLADPGMPQLQSNLLLTLLYSPTREPEEIASAFFRWGEQFDTPVLRPVPCPLNGRRLRIGYVSSNFCSNPEVFFTEPIFRFHDRSRFEVFCYADTHRPDEFTAKFRALSEHFRDITPMSDAMAAKAIRDDRIDVLVDCSGHWDCSRIRMLAEKPAPVQVSLPTYPSTTGLRTVNYRLTDGVADPSGTTEHLHTEQLIRLPRVLACYQPPEPLPEVQELPAIRNGYVTFGCFNRLSKVNSGVIEVWAQLLDAVPDAVLLFHHVFHRSAPLPQEHLEYVIHQFAALGIEPVRLRFAGTRPLADHFALFNEVDIALDPFPYCGMTTTCESLWMGVPVVTLAGRMHHARMGAALLNAAGLNGWIAANPRDYVEIAQRNAGDLATLRDLRRGLRATVEQSGLADGIGYARALEDAYCSMISNFRDST
jgi:predicted O-linked N-acetylglucosamine transferase (SPINDLY family)